MIKKVSITYCSVWNYEPVAAGLAAELEEKLGCSTELIASRGGVFEVVGDGRLLFSKKKTGRFPQFDEIARQMK